VTPTGRRILFWSPNYAPELTGIPPLVTDAAEWLAARGHAVHVATAVPNYPERRIHAGYRGGFRWRERRGDVSLERSWLRVRPGESFVDKALYEASFAAIGFPAVARRLGTVDVLVCLVPSLAAAIASAAAVRARRSRIGHVPRFVLWVQDLVLVAATAVGRTDRRAVGSLLRAAGKLESAAVRQADRVVVCSPGFEDYFVSKGVPERRIATVYNWVDEAWITPAAAGSDGRPTRLLYAGNLGYTQGFDTLIDALRLVRSPVEVELVGEGNAACEVRRLAAGFSNVRVRPPVARADFPALLASADAHLVLQRRVGAGANFPSKIASYLASGRPIIASMSGEVAAIETLRESGAALVVPPESPRQLAEAIELLHSDPKLREALGREGRRFSHERFGRDAALTTLERELVGDVVAA